MADFGLRLDGYVCGKYFADLVLHVYNPLIADDRQERCRLSIASSACHFARTALCLAKDLPAMRLPDLQHKCDDYITELWTSELDHLLSSSANAVTANTNVLIRHTIAFVLNQV